MIDNVFNSLMERRLVNWEVVRRGLTGVPGLPDILSPDRVAIFSSVRLEVVESVSPFLTHIVAMATEPRLSTNELLAMVEQICERTGSDQVHGLRCWRFGVLTELLRDPEEDPMYGLIRLDEFVLTWSAVGIDSSLPGFSTTATSEYMNHDGYLRRMEQLRDWLQIEGAALQAIQESSRS
jgi:hypothetical protein